MRLFRVIAAGAAFAVLSTVAALADGHTDGSKIYVYHSSENYCPAGLQPVTLSGEICCGQPNQSMTYQQAMAHTSPKRHARSDCPVGTKGCTFD